MGSKTPDDNGYGNNGGSSPGFQTDQADGEPRGSHLARDGDGCTGDIGGEDDDDDDDDDDQPTLNPIEAGSSISKQTPKKKRKKSKKKTRKPTTHPKQQSSPPRIPLSLIFPGGGYPCGERQDYTKSHVSAAETRNNEILAGRDENFLENYRKAAEVHRQTRAWIQNTVRPGQALLDIAEDIENSVRALLGHQGLETGDSLKAGMGFPTGLCLNHQAAHYTPNPGQTRAILQQQDVMKVDFGVHINGWIVDSAFTMTFDPTYDNLLAAVKDATNSGIKAAGIDVRISDVSAAIQEAMESYEVELRGKTFPVKAVRNLSAHNIVHYRIHGGKSIPFVKNSDQTKMEENEVFAIETYGTTGRGYMHDDIGVYGYGLNHNASLTTSLPLVSAHRLHKTIRDNFGTIVFCRRYLERLGVQKYHLGMNHLVSNGIVEQYESLMDVKGSYNAQFEHTLILHPTHKEVLSRGDDY